MKVAVLTSSRADYGIYLPLLKAIQADSYFDLRLIVFGTHLSSFHGYTIAAIRKDGFVIDHCIEHVMASDSSQSVATSMALAAMKFTLVWEKGINNYDLVFCLGDRFEMFAAVASAVPFRIPFAHLHGGETTLGAIDNEFRHCLTLFSSLHFVATEANAQRVAEIKGSAENIFTVGSLSLDNLKDTTLLSNEAFYSSFNIDLSKPTFLVTYHPETVEITKNKEYAQALVNALESFKDHQIIITMPNADTMGNSMRSIYKQWANSQSSVFLIENFGTQGYFTCLQKSKLVIGNSSSGIIEAASFGKYVVNIGDRQKGRIQSKNIINSAPDTKSIISACQEALGKGTYKGLNVYYQENAAINITTILKKWEK